MDRDKPTIADDPWYWSLTNLTPLVESSLVLFVSRALLTNYASAIQQAAGIMRRCVDKLDIRSKLLLNLVGGKLSICVLVANHDESAI